MTSLSPSGRRAIRTARAGAGREERRRLKFSLCFDFGFVFCQLLVRSRVSPAIRGTVGKPGCRARAPSRWRTRRTAWPRCAPPSPRRSLARLGWLAWRCGCRRRFSLSERESVRLAHAARQEFKACYSLVPAKYHDAMFDVYGQARGAGCKASPRAAPHPARLLAGGGPSTRDVASACAGAARARPRSSRADAAVAPRLTLRLCAFRRAPAPRSPPSTEPASCAACLGWAKRRRLHCAHAGL